MKTIFISFLVLQLLVCELRADDGSVPEDAPSSEFIEGEESSATEGLMNQWLVPGVLGVSAFHGSACAAHCSPGPVPLIQFARENPVAGCSVYLAAAGMGVIAQRVYRRYFRSQQTP